LTVFFAVVSAFAFACEVFRVLVVVSLATGGAAALVDLFVTLISGSGSGFDAAFARPLGAGFFGSTFGGSSSTSCATTSGSGSESFFAAAFPRLFGAAFFVVAFGFSSSCKSGSAFFALPRLAGALMPPPAVASGSASSSFGLRDRVATIFEAFEESNIFRFSVKGLFVDGTIRLRRKVGISCYVNGCSGQRREHERPRPQGRNIWHSSQDALHRP
jgi:hypothetical protein